MSSSSRCELCMEAFPVRFCHTSGEKKTWCVPCVSQQSLMVSNRSFCDRSCRRFNLTDRFKIHVPECYLYPRCWGCGMDSKKNPGHLKKCPTIAICRTCSMPLQIAVAGNFCGSPQCESI